MTPQAGPLDLASASLEQDGTELQLTVTTRGEWKPSQLDTRNLSAGMWGEPVRNLRMRLNNWAGITLDQSASATDYFDESLQELVMRFQANNGLTVDGIAGARTQALLDAAVASAGTPLLSAAVR